MNRYETLFIINPNLDLSEMEELTEEVKTLIQNGGGSVQLTDYWGKKRLAYAINKHTDGYYIFLIFDSPQDLVSKLNNHFLITELIMRHLVLRFEGDLDKYVANANRREQDLSQEDSAETVNGSDVSVTVDEATSDTDDELES